MHDQQLADVLDRRRVQFVGDLLQQGLSRGAIVFAQFLAHTNWLLVVFPFAAHAAMKSRALGLDHSTVIGLAGAVGGGQLSGLNEQQLVHAIGITLGGNIAISQGRTGTLSNWKNYASADASRNCLP